MARNRGAAIAAPADVDSATTQRMRIPTNGPHDGDTLGPEVSPVPGTVDFGAVRVPVPAGGMVSVEPSAAGRVQAVHITVPEGRLSISALAAPRTGGLWADLAKEIDVSLREGGARVRSFTGEWGRELHASTDGATSVFLGVDGPRWMLYGVATGPTRDAVSLDARLRRMLRATIVVRGKAPYPVRTVLPLAMPSETDGERQAAASAPPTMTLRTTAALPAGPGAAPFAEPSGAATNAAVTTNGAVTTDGMVTTNGAAPTGMVNGARPQTSNGLSPAAAGGVGPNGVASYGMSPGGVPDDATTTVARRNGASRAGGSTGATRADVPPVGGSSTGGMRRGVPPVGAPATGASRTGAPTGSTPIGAPAPIPAAGPTQGAVPPRRQPRTNGAAVPGVPFPGAPTDGVPHPAAPRAADTGSNRAGAGTTGSNRAGLTPPGGNTTGANRVGADTGANQFGGYPPAAGSFGGHASGINTGANPAPSFGGQTGAVNTGANQLGANPAPSFGGHTSGANTGSNQLGANPPASGFSGHTAGSTTGANQLGANPAAPGSFGHTTGANRLDPTGANSRGGVNQFGGSTGANQFDVQTTGLNPFGTNPAGAGQPGGTTGANQLGAANAGVTWSSEGPARTTDAEAGTSPYGMPTNGAPYRGAASAIPVDPPSGYADRQAPQPLGPASDGTAAASTGAPTPPPSTSPTDPRRPVSIPLRGPTGVGARIRRPSSVEAGHPGR